MVFKDVTIRAVTTTREEELNYMNVCVKCCFSGISEPCPIPCSGDELNGRGCYYIAEEQK